MKGFLDLLFMPVRAELSPGSEKAQYGIDRIIFFKEFAQINY